MTQADLAELIGCESRTVSQWETGHYWPQPRFIRRMADALGVSVGDIREALDSTRRQNAAPAR